MRCTEDGVKILLGMTGDREKDFYVWIRYAVFMENGLVLCQELNQIKMRNFSQ